MADPRADSERFREYETYWRRVLVEVLEWPQEAFMEFVERRREWMEQDPEYFFRHYPGRHLYDVLVPVRLRDVLASGFGLQAALLITKALKLKARSADDLNVNLSRERYAKVRTRLERVVTNHRRRATIRTAQSRDKAQE